MRRGEQKHGAGTHGGDDRRRSAVGQGGKREDGEDKYGQPAAYRSDETLACVHLDQFKTEPLSPGSHFSRLNR